LQAAFGFTSYLWQDNSTEDYYSVTQSGLYIVQVEDINGCTGKDSVQVFIGDIAHLEDTITLCEGETTTLQANVGFDSYSWSTGQSGINEITVDEPGWYWVEVSYGFGCPSSDTAFVKDTPVPVAIIQGGDMLCEGDTLWLKAPQGDYAYYWNDQPAGEQYIVLSAGNYTLKLINACGEDEDSKFVQESPLPVVDLGEDQLLFPGESITLDAGMFTSYEWNGDPHLDNQYFIVNYEDVDGKDSIRVEVFDGFCKNTGGIVIEIFDVKVPNVITPNGDGKNDTFMPMEGWSGVNRHHITVINQWGEQVWESTDFESGWDGKKNGNPVSEGTYFWILEVWYGKDDLQKVYRGTLTVLKEGG
jgi:gliding motility-associated-like protein